MSQRLFGTDGIRGTAGQFPLDAQTIARLGAALVRTLPGGDRPPAILVGRDTRESGTWIERELARGVCAAGATITSIGVAPTPAVAFLTKALEFDGGVVISASHNPFQDNGIKVFSRDGSKLTGRSEDDLEALVRDQAWETPRSAGVSIRDGQFVDRYLEHICDVLPDPGRLRAARMAVDCAHGATTTVAPRLLRKLGFEVLALNCEPTGRNINHECGSTHPEALAAFVVEQRCRVGVAFDGDGDRAMFVGAHGRIVDGDAVLLICAKYLKSVGRLRGNAVVATVMSNIGLEIALRDLGIELIRCAVGDKYVMEEMTVRHLALGGEQSGHIIFADHLQTGDGLLTALMILRAMAESGRELAELAGDLTVYPQALVNVPVREKADLETFPDIVALINEVERRLAGQGRLLVRYSGTEPLLRVMVEGQDQVQIHAWADEIAEKVRQCLGRGDE